MLGDFVDPILVFGVRLTTWVVGLGSLILWAGFLFAGASFWFPVIVLAGFLFYFKARVWVWFFCLLFTFLFGVKPVRRRLLSAPLMSLITTLKLFPQISQTEQIALAAGTVWIEKELFSGRPNFKRILNERYPSLSQSEQAFLDGPVETLCAMVKDWEIFQTRDFSPDIWEFLKKNGFFGMIIPKSFGGLEFSANGHGAVISKLSTRSSALAITVMVPNSLGPAELLIHYGTEDQKAHYLPRLDRKSVV